MRTIEDGTDCLGTVLDAVDDRRDENKNKNATEEKSGSKAGQARRVLVFCLGQLGVVPSRTKTTAERILHNRAKVSVTETLALLVSRVCNQPSAVPATGR